MHKGVTPECRLTKIAGFKMDKEVEILDEMRDRCRRLIWLNPETRQFWYSGDSEMRTYEGSCHEVRPCRNLNQLLDFIKDLVL